MIGKKLLLLLVSAFIVAGLRAQDIHFSQFNMSPMTLNPANIGAFEGTVRLGGIFRGQWSSVLKFKGQYQTPSVYADAPIIRGFRKNDWVGVGLMFFSDKAGIPALTHSAAKLGASYHLALNKKATTYVTLGAQYGKASRKIDPNGLQFELGFNPDNSYTSANDVDSDNLNRDKASWTDIDGGIVLKSKLNKQMDFSLGYAMYHIGKGKYGLVTGGGGTGPNPGPVAGSNDKIGRRSVATGTFNIKLNDKFTVSPSFIYQNMNNNHDEIILQGLGSYLFNEEKDISLLFGLGYRMRDAIHPIVGAQVKSLRVGLAYDVNISDLNSETNYRGGFELAAWYIIKIYKPAVVKTKVLCPRF